MQVWNYTLQLDEDKFNYLQKLVLDDPLLRVSGRDEMLAALASARDGKCPVRDEKGDY